MSETSSYCPVSARFTSGSEPLYTPADVQAGRLDDDTDLAEVALDGGERVAAEIPQASDACFAAFQASGYTVLVSRVAYDVDELDEITRELIAAVEHGEHSGVLRARVTSGGHVVACVDAPPLCARVTGPTEVRTLFDELAAAHAEGLVHGGINDRWVNPHASPGRRVFGFGFASAYAAWRRRQSLAIGDLVGDPRFASPEELRGEGTGARGDRHALAAVCLTELGAIDITGDPVQGVNAFLERAGQPSRLRQSVEAVGDRAAAGTLDAALSGREAAKPPWWRIGFAAAAVLLLVSQCFLITRGPRTEAPAETASTSESEIRCTAPGTRLVGDECVLANGVGRCGQNTYYDPSTNHCVAVLPSAEERDDGSDEPQQTTPQGPWIHPVLECPQGQQMIDFKFSFGTDDINFTLGEKTRLSRLAAQCEGEAELIYYTSEPGLESRAYTIFEEFRSSSHCEERCRPHLPVRPTAVLYIPYVGLLERANDHYLFFHCCGT